MSSTLSDTFTSFGELLQYLRQRSRLTQSALGRAVGYTGAHITRLENGMRRPDPMVVRARFIDALNLRDEPALAQQLITLAAAAERGAPAATQPRSNLPAQLTSFVGRRSEIARLMRLLGTARLLTLTGTGGVGKTRLAIEVGAVIAQAAPQGTPSPFADGVWLVDLAPVSDPLRVPHAVKEALQLPDELGRSLIEALVEYLTPRHLLLLLDNCEHLVSACAELAEALLSTCPGLRILATSREVLQCPGEVVWRVPSLETPCADSPLTLEQVTPYEAIQLFVTRATSAQPDFQLTQANAMEVTRICAHLDGIPLAIEMAAARITAMSAHEIAARLDDRFALLANGRRAAVPRQRTLRATLEWSYNLLTEPERVLLARLSVFADGCTVELAETVCADGDAQAVGTGMAPRPPSMDGLCPSDILPLLLSLVSKSLVVANAREEHKRYRLLETVRQYAAEKLAERGEADILYLRLAAYLTKPTGSEDEYCDESWIDMFQAELGNVRNLIVWARHANNHAEIILRVAYEFGNFAPDSGQLAEPLAWLEEGLAAGKPVPIRLHAMCLYGKLMLLMFTGYNLARWSAEVDELVTLVDFLDTPRQCSTFLFAAIAAVGRGDLDGAEHMFERMRAFAQHKYLRFSIGVSLIHQSLVHVVRGDMDGANELLRQAFELRMGPDLQNVPLLRPAAMIWVSTTQALTLIESGLSFYGDSKSYELGVYQQLYVQAQLLSGNYALAQARALESLDLFRHLNLLWSHGFGIGEALLELGRIALLQDDSDAARAYGEQCLELYLRIGDMEHAAQAHTLLGYAALGLGDLESAAKRLRRGLSLFSELGQRAGSVVALAGLAALAEAHGDIERAARLYGASDVPPESLLLWLSQALWALRLTSRVIYDHAMAAARKRYAGTQYAAAWAEGRAMTLDQAMDYALAV